MANAINLTTGEVALSRDPSLLLPLNRQWFTDQRLGLSTGGPLNASNGDYFEVWMDVAGAGSQVTVMRMQF